MSAIPDLERVVFFPGQLLTAEDLRALNQNNEQMRWLHNRTLHDWGICEGLDVTGSRGKTFVKVSPGYAVDSGGHEIILSAPTTKPIPAVAGGAGGSSATFYLVANYIADAQESVLLQRGAGACSPSGAARLSNEPAVLWKTAAQLNLGVDVILTQASIQNCVLASDVSGAARRQVGIASPLAMASGAIAAANITWSSWAMNGVNLGFTAAIDASSGNFQSTPRYFATIVGERSLANPSLVVVDFVSLAHESPAGFTLQVALPALPGGVNPANLTDPVTGPKLLTQLGWSVSWLGIEG